MSESVLSMAKDLVQAQIEANQLSPDNIAEALQRTHANLLALKTQEETGSSTAHTYGLKRLLAAHSRP